jgi:DNA topoisomerase-1
MANWILRKGSKERGFRYVRENGAVVPAAVRARIEALRIPPAWTQVHIAKSAQAAVQAWGFDAKGRKQYRYHARSVQRGETRKHYRVRELGQDLPSIRKRIGTDFRRRDWSRDRVAAGVVRLISEKFFRVGSERYAKENGTFGIATMRKKHATVWGTNIIFTYSGKRSIEQRQTVFEPALARFIGGLLETPGPRLFRYQDGNGRWQDLTARDINEYLRETVGVAYTAKDFRTWGGTLRAATILADLGPAATPNQAKKNTVMAIRMVAWELGNTPAICRKSYVHPIVIAQYLDEGETIRLPAGRQRKPDGESHAVEERALLRFLDEHFPERRRRRRAPDDE